MTNNTAYSARNESLKLGILLTALCLSLIYGDWLWRWDRLLYDVQSSMIEHKASDDIVIIAVDENSLQSLGRWPWERSIHAELINKLTAIDARAILIDMIFAEASINPVADQQLASAIRDNGKVVLPVLLEQTRLRGQLIETLPIPELTQYAASLGHVHVELDQDGIARGSYLYEGLGQARWPHIGLATLQAADYSVKKPEEPLINSYSGSTWTWIRREHFLIPFVGPPGSFKTISYVNVLQDQQLSETLKDKIVLVGVTASGLGDSLPTPVSGLSHPMPGIEINANILQAILNDAMVYSVEGPVLYLLSTILILTPILLFPYLSPRFTLILVLSEIISIFLVSLLLLHTFQTWIPISAILSCLLLSYPLWAWRRLEFTVKYLNAELITLTQEADELQKYVANEVEMEFTSLQDLVPVSGISVFDNHNLKVLAQGKEIFKCAGKVKQHEWLLIKDNIYGTKILIGDAYHRLCIQWRFESAPDEQQTRILKTYIRQQVKPKHEIARTTVEIIESRINNIKDTTDKLAYLRQFVTDSLEQMADGVVVIDSLGNITLVNRQAARLFTTDDNLELLHQSIFTMLDRLNISGNESWESIIDAVLSNKHYENLQVSTDQGKDLVVNISPLCSSANLITGFIINLSDITEIKDAQRKRNEMLSFLSHDLRSPLVSALALLAQTRLKNSDDTSISRIEKNINSTIELAEDFVHLSRIEGDDDIIFTSINMADVIANSVDTIWDQANKKQTTIKQILADECWVSGNGAILERVITNLLSNAVKYSDERSVITVNLTQHEGNIKCSVCDTGPGIPAEELPLLFNRFKRIEQNNMKQSGIGLGLAFVHAAISRHQGEVMVDSEPGKGSCFIITLPTESQ